MSHEDIEATKAPLMDHLIELRSRLIKALIAFGVMFAICFVFAKDIYNVLVWPFVWVAGPENSKFIYTALLEYFVTQLKLSLFGAAFISFPIVAGQIYMFVAPGLYKHERNAFLPYLVATPFFFVLGAALVYFTIRRVQPMIGAASTHRLPAAIQFARASPCRFGIVPISMLTCEQIILAASSLVMTKPSRRSPRSCRRSRSPTYRRSRSGTTACGRSTATRFGPTGPLRQMVRITSCPPAGAATGTFPVSRCCSTCNPFPRSSK